MIGDSFLLFNKPSDSSKKKSHSLKESRPKAILKTGSINSRRKCRDPYVLSAVVDKKIAKECLCVTSWTPISPKLHYSVSRCFGPVKSRTALKEARRTSSLN